MQMRTPVQCFAINGKIKLNRSLRQYFDCQQNNVSKNIEFNF